MPSEPAHNVAILLEFMLRLARAYLACGEQTALIELKLRAVAQAYGMRRARVIAFPTAIFISLNDGGEERVALAEGPTESLRLDQIGDVYTLGDAAKRGEVKPADGISQLAQITRKPSRFGPFGLVVGHTILSVGLAIVLMPALNNIVATAILGAIVGLLRVLNRGRPMLAVPLPVLSATLVSALVFLANDWNLPVDPLYALIPPLVSFLPGGMLTLGMEELAYGDMVSGSSRLITGFVQLVLLTFGLVAGAAFTGYHPDQLLDYATPLATAPWTPWAGILVFGVGVFIHFSAPRKSLLWILLVLFVTFGAQQLAARSMGDQVSGFFGMLIATLLGLLIQWRLRGPQSMVTILPSFWLLVPGALSLQSFKQMLTDRDAGLADLTTAVVAFTAIALGSLMGASLYKWLAERFGWWQLQLGRFGRFLRAKNNR